MVVIIDSDGYEENYVLISSFHCIIFNKISASKNTVFLIKLYRVGVGRNLTVFSYGNRLYSKRLVGT